jgi:hypothetical protein
MESRAAQAMSFIDLLRRRHLHADTEVRLRVVSRLGSQRILARIARTDPDARVRAEAGRRVVDASVLEALVLAETDPHARLSVIRCLTDVNAIVRLLGAGRLKGEDIAALVEQLHDQQVLSEVARTSRHADVRVEAIRCIRDPRVLEDIVVKDVERDVRVAAARCLRDARAVSRLLQKGDLEADAVGAFDGATRSAALKVLSNTQSLRELARLSPFDRIRREALHGCDHLSRELAECLSEDKPEWDWSRRVDKLLDQGADPNVVDEKGCPAICVVARRGYPSTVKRLLDLGADMNTSKPDGTPLEIAASQENNNVVELLLQQRALRPEDAFRAAQSALELGKTGTAAILLKFLDTLKSERYQHISALQVGATFVVVVEGSSYSTSILEVVESFMVETLEWRLTEGRELHHRWDHHVQDRTYSYVLRPKGDDRVAGHFMRRHYSSDYGIGFESSKSTGGVLVVYLDGEAARNAAARLVSFVRAVNEKAQ